VSLDPSSGSSAIDIDGDDHPKVLRTADLRFKATTPNRCREPMGTKASPLLRLVAGLPPTEACR
jgi:hypothetical protein